MSLEEALEFVALSDVGKVREHNEDACAIKPELGFAVVADGMGGYNSGEVASAMAVETVTKEVFRSVPNLVPGQTDPNTGLHYETIVLRDAISLANSQIYRTAHADKQHQGMGTTVASVLFWDNRVSLAHVGDSRIYRLRKGVLTPLTKDHSVVQEALGGSSLSEEEAKEAFHSNLVTRALGVEKRTVMDLVERSAQPEDIFLLCSDGLTNMVDNETITKIITKKARDLNDAAKRLVQQANRNGGMDNISVVLVRVIKTFSASGDWQAKVLDIFAPR